MLVVVWRRVCLVGQNRSFVERVAYDGPLNAPRGKASRGSSSTVSCRSEPDLSRTRPPPPPGVWAPQVVFRGVGLPVYIQKGATPSKGDRWRPTLYFYEKW